MVVCRGDSMTEEELKSIEDGVAAATPGEWIDVGCGRPDPCVCRDNGDGTSLVIFDHVVVDRHEFTDAEADQAAADVRFAANARQDVPALCAEVRASWAAINDLRQDSAAYRRAIVDVVRLISNRGVMNTLSESEDLARAVADMALTEDEFRRAWEGEPAPLGAVYDAEDHGAAYECLDAETGERIAYVKRACPESGWYEAFDTDPNGEILMPPALRRHWRRVKVVVS